MRQLLDDQVGHVVNHFEGPVRGKGNTTADDTAAVAQEEEGKQGHDQQQGPDAEGRFRSADNDAAQGLFGYGPDAGRQVIGFDKRKLVMQAVKPVTQVSGHAADIARQVLLQRLPCDLPVRDDPGKKKVNQQAGHNINDEDADSAVSGLPFEKGNGRFEQEGQDQ